jgi:uncharacterized protein
MPGGPMVVGGGLGTLLLILVALYFGVDPQLLLGPPGGGNNPVVVEEPAPAGVNDEMREFVGVVLKDTEDVWQALFRDMGRSYRKPHLVLFSNQVNSACGFASAAVGPFYCPGDERVYLDLSFFRELQTRFHAAGDFAQAYVIAHEIGHHVQKLMGISGKIDAMRARMGREEFNRVSVRMELQADFFAGVWAHHAQQTKEILERGDIESAIRAASAIGDDTLQREQQGYVVPDSFTHGTSAQRVRWFRLGLETGDISAGDTFNAEEL